MIELKRDGWATYCCCGGGGKGCSEPAPVAIVLHDRYRHVRSCENEEHVARAIEFFQRLELEQPTDWSSWDQRLRRKAGRLQ